MLNRAFMANAVFSSVCGIIIFVLRDWFALQIPGPDWLFLAISIGLVVFAVQLLLMVKFKSLAEKLVLQVVFSDIGWVVFSTLGLIIFIESFSHTGIWMVVLINLIVTLLAWLQFSAYKKAGGAT